MPMGMLLMRSLDHLMLACVGGGVELTVAMYKLAKACTIVEAAIWSWCRMTFGPPVTIRLPFAVHLMVAI